MKSRLALLIVFSYLSTTTATVASQPLIKVDIGKLGAPISPQMWGIFFEDINFGADGGLYAELVKNRSFEFPEPLMGWSRDDESAGTVEVQEYPGSPVNAHFLRVVVSQVGQDVVLTHEGFAGMGIRQSQTYRFSVQARHVTGGQVTLRAELVAADGSRLGQVRLDGFTDQWATYVVAAFPALGTDAKAQLKLHFEGSGTLDVDMISLFPTDTWKGRVGGLRKDLVQLLADMKPGFLRFPGGCIVEGRNLEQRYDRQSQRS